MNALLLEDVASLHVYLPFNLEFAQLQDQNKISIASVIYSSVLSNCDIGPISAAPVDDSAVPCIKKYSEV